ncbi:MAG: TM2 domain-containing protein [Rothia sp. (in: high G+C Gram-positive bacteria)]|nr:TM2 domain-containing protein [Rothia sp. (in: high G+C Gram-positive bacteria)]
MTGQPEHYRPTPLPTDGRAQSFAQGQPVYVVKAKSNLIAYLLFFFLWWLGAHKFYLRQPFMGITYIVLNLIAGGLFSLVPFIFWIAYIPVGLMMLWDLFTMPIRVGFLNSLATQRANYR